MTKHQAADLIAFLRARLDEDEQAARHAHGNKWTHDERTGNVEADESPLHQPVAFGVGDPDGAYITRHSPARVLRDVEAKRRLLDLADKLEEMAWDIQNLNDTVKQREIMNHGGLVLAARYLAQAYADHPDYSQEWTP